MNRHLTIAISCSLLTLAGCSSDGDGGPITVSGRVVDEALQGVSSVPVVVLGHPSVSTDADGRFSVGGVVVPYDLAVLSGAGNRFVVVYQGLRRPDPTVLGRPASGSILVLPPRRSASLFGTIAPYSANAVAVRFGSREGSGSTLAESRCIPTPCRLVYTLSPSDLQWRGPTTTTGSLFALEYQLAPSGLPERFLRWGKYTDATGKNQLTLADGGSYTANLDLSDVASARLNGVVNAPGGYTIRRKTLWVEWPGGTRGPSFSDATPSDVFDFVTPNLPPGEGSVGISVLAAGPAGLIEVTRSGLPPETRRLVVSAPEPPVQQLPVDQATGVGYETEFSWAPVPGAIYAIPFLANTGGSTFLIEVVTAEPRARIPDLRAQGMGLPPSTPFGWLVGSYAPFSSVDEAAGPDGLEKAGDRTRGLSAGRSFTTK